MMTWMDLQGIILNEISQADTHTQKDILLYHYMWNLKKLNSLEVENRTVTEAWRWGNWKDVV